MFFFHKNTYSTLQIYKKKSLKKQEKKKRFLICYHGRQLAVQCVCVGGCMNATVLINIAILAISIWEHLESLILYEIWKGIRDNVNFTTHSTQMCIYIINIMSFQTQLLLIHSQFRSLGSFQHFSVFKICILSGFNELHP